MTTEELLAGLEALTASDRVRRMIALGRQARADPEAAAVLRALAAGGFYERRLALLACSGSRDGAHALGALWDPSRLLRGLAISLIPIICSDDQVVEALEAAPPKARVALLTRLGHRRRQFPVDVFFNRTDPFDVFLGRLAGGDAVRRHLDALSPRFGPVDWRRLADLHPDIALETLTQQADALAAPDARLRLHVNAVLPLLSETRPDGALALARTLLRHAAPAQVTLQPLADRRPNEVADLVLASEDRALVSFQALAGSLTPERLLDLVRRRPGLLGAPARWMRRLTPPARRAVYEVAALGWRSAEGVLDPAVAALLPGGPRAEEARRHLALPALATRPAQRLPYASLLPWDEARAALDPSVRSPDADLRATALGALIGAARFERARLPDALALARTRAHEQDPVRRAMLAALAALPPARWAGGHLDDLGRIIRDALSAADLSPATAAEAERLVVALMPFHPDWAAPWLATLARERGQVHLPSLGGRLSDAQALQIAPALMPVLASWETREREGVLLQAARSLGRRLRVLPELAEMLARVAMGTPQSYYASQALALLAEHQPVRLATLIPALIARDASVVTLPAVYRHLHRRRQDLLTPFLGQQAYPGRFSTGKTRFVLPLTGGFGRWTPAQQRTFAQTLDGVTRDPARDTPALLAVIGQMAVLPDVFPDRLVALARPAEKPATRDAALRALARLDAGLGVPTLVEALDDERARVAIYALRATLLEMPGEAALALLRAMPLDRVTVAKEVARLLGDLKTPDAYPALLAMMDGRGAPDGQPLHRDVRVAVLRALWEHLEDDRTWPALERAAADPDPAVAGGVVRIPTLRLSPPAQSRLVRLIAALLAHPDPRVRMDVLARCADLPLTDPDEVILPRLLSAMGSRLPDESAAAARAVFQTYAGAQARAVGGAVGAIRGSRRALKAATDTLQIVLTWNRWRQQPTVRAVLAALEADPLTATARAELALAGLPPDEAAAVLADLAQAGALHPEALMAAVRATERIRSQEDGGLERLESALAAAPEAGLRRVALAALVAQAAQTGGWSEDRRGRLQAYRRDPSPLVAAAAQFTFPPEDSPTEDSPSEDSLTEAA